MIPAINPASFSGSWRMTSPDVSRRSSATSGQPVSGTANVHKFGFLFAIKGQQTVIGPSGVDDGTADFPSGETLYR
jgi:hypothetical protein